MNELLSRVPGNPREGKEYQEEYGLVGDYDDAQIINFINHFDPREVVAGLFFYLALLDMAKERKLLQENHQ